MSKRFIAENLLGKRSDILYWKFYKEVSKNILSDDYEMEMIYTSTLEWSYIDHENLIRFVDTFIGMASDDL